MSDIVRVAIRDRKKKNKLSRGKHARKIHVQRDEEGRIVGTDGEGDGEDQEHDDTQAAAESALLHFSKWATALVRGLLVLTNREVSR